MVGIWVRYSLVRLSLFAGALAVLLLLQVPWYFAAPIAALIGLCIAYIFFDGQQKAAIAALRAKRADEKAGVRAADSDEAAEDAL